MSTKAILSKSTFIKGLQCEKQLHLYKHHYNWQDKISDMQQSVFNRGHRVGALAQTLFPNGVDASPSSPRAYAKAVEHTRELIEDGSEVIYEAAFMYNEVIVYADIIVRNGDKWKVYEVKSSTSVSDTNITDISVQYYVMTNCGLEIKDISVIHINTDYVRHGELDLQQLFRNASLLPYAVDNLDWVGEEVERLKAVVRQERTPRVDIGLHCTDPYQCSFSGHCWRYVPENSVFDISWMHLDKKFELYDSGIKKIDDIPDEYILPRREQIQVDCHKSGDSIIDEESISEFLKEFKYPLYFLDFESFQPAVPLYDNSKPYQQIVFQCSLHYQNGKRSKLEHREFLAEASGDPRIPFIENLIKDTKTEGQIVVFNKAFEVTRLKEIARDFPKYSEPTHSIIERIVDLMIPFQKKWYYTPEMQGSYSIKKVLPALVPELSYDGLDIADEDFAKLNEIKERIDEYLEPDE